jgi:hypothetical protein
MNDRAEPDHGPFKPLPPEELDRLIKKGADDARELDHAIRDQFEQGPEARLVCR